MTEGRDREAIPDGATPPQRGAAAHSRLRWLCALWFGCAVALASTHASAGEAVTLVLNWVPSAEHAPFFYAAEQGWYRDAGLDVTIDAVAGSPQSIQRAAAQADTLAVADFVTFLRVHRAHPDTIAIMALQPRSPYALYYTARTPVRTVADFNGKRIAAQPDDPMRGLWEVLARRNGSAALQVDWVALSNPAKPDALAAGAIDAALNPFLHNHLNYAAALGDTMRVLWWHELGFAAYGHVLVAGSSMTAHAPDRLRQFVAITQRAWAHCLRDAAPCLDALLAQHPQLDRAHEAALAQLVARLNADPSAATLGAFDATRVAAAARDVAAVAGPVDAAPGLTTNRFLSEGIRAPMAR